MNQPPDAISDALNVLRTAGWTCIPRVDPKAAIPKPEVGQIWISPKPRVAARTVVKIAPHKWYPSGVMCVYFTTPDGRASYLHTASWHEWARKAQARPEITTSNDLMAPTPTQAAAPALSQGLFDDTGSRVSQRNRDYMHGWRDGLNLATFVRVSKFYAETVNPNPAKLPEPQYPVAPAPSVVDDGLPFRHLTDGANI